MPTDSPGEVNVLILSSSAKCRQLVRAALAEELELDCHVADCEALDAALAQVGHRAFDLIVLAGNLKDVRAMAQAGAMAPIVFLAQGAEAPRREDVLAHGAAEFLAERDYANTPAMLQLALRQTLRFHAVDRQRRLLGELARQRGTEVSQLTQQLLRASPFDQRTGWYTERKFLERFVEELSRAQRYGLPLALVFIHFEGLTEFKANHDVELFVLLFSRVSELMRTVIRQTDLLGHYPGDACSVLLTNTDQGGGVRFCTRVNEALAHPLAVEEHRVCLTCHFGLLAREAVEPQKAADLLAEAERLLEKAKTMPGASIVTEAT